MINKVLFELVEFLSQNQNENGSFSSLTTTDKNFEKAKSYESVFLSALILSSIYDLEGLKNLENIKKNIADFLLSQKSLNWTFNYWVKNSKESKRTPYPDDLDDTFCSLAALYKYDENIIDGEVLAKSINVLTALEVDEGGPYRTWLVPDDADEAWKDVDLAVNSNIGNFLNLIEVDLPNINRLVEDAVEINKLKSPYYVGELPVIFFISRFYKGVKKKKIVSYLLSKQNKNGGWGNPLKTALAINSLLNFGLKGREIKKAVEYLEIKSEYLTKAYPFVVELIKGTKKYYSGSSALTAAMCMQAFHRYDQLINKDVKKSDEFSKDMQIIRHKVVMSVEKRFGRLDAELKEYASVQLINTLETDKNHPITLLPAMFALSLKRNKKIDREKLIEFGAANLYGWIAYTIYDDFLDDEGNSKYLSVANVCLRELGSIYRDNGLYDELMDRIDCANAWEVTRCRVNPKQVLNKKLSLPNYGDLSRLADRSVGHALGPLSILLELGYKQRSKEVKALQNFFEHYLIARQLNDDMHDWEDDLKVGHINLVGAVVLKNYYDNYIGNKKSRSYQKLEEIFWYEEVENVCELLMSHIDKARKEMEKLSELFESNISEKMLSKIHTAADQALGERKTALEFLKNYIS